MGDVMLPARDPKGHKGTFGSVAVFGGCAHDATRMIGAPALAARAALRVGAGLARVIMPEPILSAGMSLTPSATGVGLKVDGSGQPIGHEAAAEVDRQLGWASVLVVGPGLGVSEGAEALVLRAVAQDRVPVVIDADGLNALAGVAEFWRDFRAAAVLTPHPGEFRRLAAALKIAADPTSERERPAAAEALARRVGAVVVLKGAGTIVSDGVSTWRCDAGHPCLATAGTGDVLAGAIAGLIAQFAGPAWTPPAMPGRPAPEGFNTALFKLACAGVLAHARGGEAWGRKAQAGMLAEELADLLPVEVDRLRGGGPIVGV